ncbi:MAG: motif-containing cysteine-rich protein [Nevskia sp.]|nr:motif-containing cysteine-rich protein [Nevskia sp.]
MEQLEHAEVGCPSCWESVELTLDLSAGSQTYTEDCPVCCQPMLVRLRVDPDEGSFNVEVEAENA